MREEQIIITGVGSQLQGVGRAVDGRTLFVRGAIPGERVEAHIVREEARFSNAEVSRILEAHPGRVVPTCPYEARCGGCQAQHMVYALSLELKQRKVKDAFERIGGVKDAPVMETIGSPDVWRYRNKAEYGVDVRSGYPVVGTTQSAGKKTIDVADCLLQHEHSVGFLNAAREALAATGNNDVVQLVTRVNPEGKLMGIVCVRNRGKLANEKQLSNMLFDRLPFLASLYVCALGQRPTHALDGQCRLLRGEERLPERMGDLRFELSPHSFFQVNRAQAERLIRELIRLLDLAGDETLVDAYCGIGTLTLPLAQRVKRAVGVEIVAPAIQDAKRAAQQNGIKNVDFICGDAGAEIAALIKRGLKPDIVVADPPRKGVDAKLIDQLLQCKPEKIGYVSCDVGTLARDVKLLTQSGAYQVNAIQPLDMFPWTEHVECVVLMSRAK